jgi:hypothetical protein
VTLNTPASFDVYLSYDADAASAGGTYQVTLGPQIFTGTVQKSTGEPVLLGRAALEKGPFDIVVAAKEIKGAELMRLRGLELRPSR